MITQPPCIPQHGIVRLPETPRPALVDEEGQVCCPGGQGEFFERVEEVDAVFLFEAGLPDPGEGEGSEDPIVIWDGPACVEVGEGGEGGGNGDGEGECCGKGVKSEVEGGVWRGRLRTRHCGVWGPVKAGWSGAQWGV
jgi:hypothetical protein